MADQANAVPTSAPATGGSDADILALIDSHYTEEFPDAPAPAPTRKKANAPAAQEAAPQEPEQPETDSEPADESVEASDVDESEAQAQEDEPEYDITHDGQSKRLKLSELREYAQKGFDYTTKTQAIAAEREAVKQVQQALHQQQQIMTALHEQVFERQQAAKDYQALAEVDLTALAETDPLAALQQEIKIRQAQQRLHAADAKLREGAQAWQQAQSKQSEAVLQHELALARERIPAWRDESKRAEEAKAIRDYLQAEGYAKEEIAGLTDHRALVMARKAWLYDKLQASKPGLQKRAEEVAKQPAAANRATSEQIEAKKLRSRLSKTGDFRDAAAWFEKTMR